MVTIFYSSFMLQLLSTAEQGANERHPFDIGFIQTEEKNNISIEELYHIIDTTDHPITEHYMIETFDYFEPHSGYDLDYRYTFVPIKEFNKLHTGQLHIPEGHYIYFINQNAEYAFGNSDYENGIAINTSQNPITLSLEKTINGQLFNNLNYHNFDFIILNDADYELIKNTVEVYDAKIHLLNVTDWKRTTIAVQGLIEKLQSKNTVTEPLFERIEFTSEQELLMPSAKVEDYTYNRQGAGLLLFLSTFLGVLFFFATFMILFLRLYSDIDQEKKRVNKLYKIGVTKVEISKLVSRELQILFISAPIVGILIAFVYLTIFFKDVGGLTHSILVSFSIISGLYLFLQLIYYFYARTRFYNEITDELV
ncbi:ABC transporter permease [Halalkalibacter okhensis]|uniref:ABC3 transporter permease protein domain-containing protein n=1 Tax=Halalkalibacter okhensis TaxID=333138 RepID=A0A0B0IIZ2_9BACI|nr:ABC transporter permease [Halalkalibacter okhensis]KHF39641.1 hypothetical protein LQ50_13485 [Halalkalibacter okhensis]